MARLLEYEKTGQSLVRESVGSAIRKSLVNRKRLEEVPRRRRSDLSADGGGEFTVERILKCAQRGLLASVDESFMLLALGAH